MLDNEKIFDFEGAKPVRCVVKDGEPWFVAQDVCRAIGITKIAQAISRLPERQRATFSVGTPGGPQAMVIITEGALYKFILRSRAAYTPGTDAYRFTDWVTDAVIPAIRREGRYELSERLAVETIDLDNKTTYAEMAKVLTTTVQDAWKECRRLKPSCKARRAP